MATPENLHKNIPNDQLHSPKDFSTAGSGTALRKGWDGELKWEVPYWQDSVLDRVDMALTPPTELDGDRYILINLTSTVVHADWDGASENDIVEYDLDASAWVSQTPFFDITVRSQADLTQYYFDGTTWNDASGGGITNIVEDTTPQLGGTLDANGNIIDMGVNTITDTKVGNWDTAFGWGDHSTAGYLSNVVEDTTPQLGGDLDVQTNEIISTGSNNIGLHSNASAYVELGDNLGTNTFDIRDNASGVKVQILSSGDTAIGKTTSLNTAWLSISTSNNNRAHINLEGSSVDKTTPVDGDLWYNTTAGTLNFYDGTTTTDLLAGGGGGLANVVDDTTPQLGGSLDVNGNKIVSVSNGNIDIEPNGTGNVLLGNFTFDADQTVGAGQDNYVLTYDNASGLISLEASAGGGGLTAPTIADTIPYANTAGNDLEYSSNFRYVTDELQVRGTSSATIFSAESLTTPSTNNFRALANGLIKGSYDGVNWSLARFGTAAAIFESTSTGDGFGLRADGSELLMLYPSGNVLIGDSSYGDPSVRLKVKGNGTQDPLLVDDGTADIFRVKDSGVCVFKTFTVATLPTAVAGGFIYVSDETGGATMAFSDGTNWRRTTDLAIVS
jgi:hypothetical protein